MVSGRAIGGDHDPGAGYWKVSNQQIRSTQLNKSPILCVNRHRQIDDNSLSRDVTLERPIQLAREQVEFSVFSDGREELTGQAILNAMCMQADQAESPESPPVLTSEFLRELIKLSGTNRVGRQYIKCFLNITMDYWRLRFDPTIAGS